MNYDELKQAALEWVNKVRIAHLQDPLTELPTGVPRHFLHCPLATALGPNWTVGCASAWLWDKPYEEIDSDAVTVENVPLPATARAFRYGFDNGEFPELISGVDAPARGHVLGQY